MMHALSPTPMPDARPSILADLDRGISIARRKLGSLYLQPEEPDAGLVERAGGRRLADARRALAEAAAERDAVATRLARWPAWISTSPALRRIARLPDPGPAASRARKAKATLDAALAAAHGRASSYLAERAKAESDALRRKLNVALSRFEALRERLGRPGLPLLAPRSQPLSPQWIAEIERALARGEVALRPKASFRVLPGLDAQALSDDRQVLETSLRARWFAMPERESPGIVPLPPDSRWTVSRKGAWPAGIAGIRLGGVADVPAPECVSSPRTRVAVPFPPRSYGRPDRLYLPVPGEGDVARACVAAGAEIGRRGGVHLDISKVDAHGPVSAFLPFVAKPLYAPLPIDLIPSSSWGGNLSHLLASSCWGRIRKAVTSRFGGQCQVCGELRQGQAIECHEVWDYEAPEEGASSRVQRLVGLLSVCRPCHRIFHVGSGGGKVEEAVVRLADVNGWTMSETHEALDWAQACWEMRSEWEWRLDLTLLGSAPLVVDSRRWRETGDGRLEGIGVADAAPPTAIVGAPWRLGAEAPLRR